MKMFKNLVLLGFVLALAACDNSGGSSYLGKWVRADDARYTLEISQNGDSFLIKDVSPARYGQSLSSNIPAVLKDGLLQTQTGFGAVNVAYVKNTDTLTMPGGGTTPLEYKRVK